MAPTDKSPSPAIAAAARILQLLWAESPEGLGVTEIARRLDLSKASTLRFLQALAAHSLVLRHPRNLSYTLGPALIQLGAKASGDSWTLGIVQDALSALSTASGMNAEAYRIVADCTMVCVASCAGPGPISITRHVGATIEASPPIGLMQMAWAKSEIDPEELGFHKDFFKEDLAFIRRNCFAWALGAGGNTAQNLAEVDAWLEASVEVGIGRKSAAGRKAQLAEIRRYTDRQLASQIQHARSMLPTIAIGAPVFDWNGKVTFRILTVSLLAQVRPQEVMAYGRLVRAEARRITEAVGGYFPATV